MMLLSLLFQLALASPDVALAEGNASFAVGDYTAAYTHYHTVLDAGKGSAPLFYNLGTTYVRLDSLPRAVQYFEKARALAPDDARIAHNLSFVRERLRLDIVQQPEPYWHATWTRVRRGVPALWLWWLGFTCTLGAATLAGWRMWYKPGNAWLRRGAVSAGALGVLLLGAAYSISAGAGVPQRAVVLEHVVVRDSSQNSTTFRAGEIVVVREQNGDRRGVARPGDAPAWVPASLLGPI